MVIGSVVIGLTATEIRGVVVCRATSAIGIVIFCHATLATHGIVVYCAVMALCGFVVCRTTTAIRSIIFGCTAILIGGIIFDLTATGICSVVICRATLAIGVAVFHCTTLAICGVVICRTTTSIRRKHKNQPKEGHASKMPATEAKQQATNSPHDERTRGWHNTNASATTAMGTMKTVTAAPPQQCAVNTKISQTRDTRQRCLQQRQSNRHQTARMMKGQEGGTTRTLAQQQQWGQ